MKRKILLITVLVLLMLFAVAPVMSLPVSAEENAEESEVETSDVLPAATIFSDGFEGAWSWSAGDWDSGSGYDYWGKYYGGTHTGSYSAWCAENGDQPSGVNYDLYMRAYMYRTVSLSGYSSVTLSFWYWTENELSYDYLQVMYHPAGAMWTEASWIKTGAKYTGYHGWTQASVSIPNTANAVGFYFYSDHSNVERGSVVDDVTLTGVIATVNTVLDFTFTPNPVAPGVTVQLQGTLRDISANPVYPAQVVVEYSTNGGVTWNYAWTLSTNAAGAFSKTFSAPGTSGNYLARVSYAGSATYNPSSHTETLVVGAVWGDYHFRINPWIDVMHFKISGNVVYGVHEIPGMYSETPLLGYIEGSTFYLFIDYPDGVYSQEIMMLVGSTSTLSGNAYQTQNGKSWTYAASFSLTSVASSSELSATESSLASAVEPEAWPPTYHFQLSPWIDIVRLGIDGSVLHGTDEAGGLYLDQPVLGYVSGSFVMLGIDWTKSGLTYEFGIIRASTSTMSGYAYRTTNGKSFYAGPTISFVSV